MALTFTNIRRNYAGNRLEVSATAAFDSSYPTGGEPVTLAELGVSQIDEIRSQGALGYAVVWNGSTTAPTLLAFYGDNNNAADGPLIEVPNATNLATLVGVRVTAIGV